MMYIYKLIDNDNRIIYVGKTKNIHTRIQRHFSSHGHLPKEAYDNVNKIMFMNVGTKANMDMLELYYINKYKPRYNQTSKTTDTLTIDLQPIVNRTWTEYNKELIDDPMCGCQTKPIYLQSLRKAISEFSGSEIKIMMTLIAYTNLKTGEVIYNGKPLSNKDIGKLSGYKTTTVSASLSTLVKNNFITTNGSGMGRKIYVNKTLLKYN